MKVAFASCSHVGRVLQDIQPIWGIIRQQHPDLLLLLGDNVYNSGGFVDGILDAKYLAKQYEQQLNEHHFKKLIEEVDYLAIWDNHDFGVDSATYGSTVSDLHQRTARGLFNKYLKYGSKRPWSEHVYCSYQKENVKFIMLDVRSAQQAPGPTAQLIDAEQEAWLKDEMINSTAEVNVICSGLPYSIGADCWTQYSGWCNRFNDMAARTSKPIFLGGNIHVNRFITHTVIKDPVTSGILAARSEDSPLPAGAQYMYEAISSAVGQNFHPPEGEENPHDPEDIDNGDDNTLAGLPRNNYGILDITESYVRVSLYGQKLDCNHVAQINRQSWVMDKYYTMVETEPVRG